jgi:hypothetical protein
LAGIAWQYVYSNYLIVRYFESSPPRWLRNIHFWMPDTLSVRLLNAFGFRFDMARYDSNTGFVLASTAIEAVMWAAIVCAMTLALIRLRKAGSRSVAAA